jgi:hypothetical protein
MDDEEYAEYRAPGSRVAVLFVGLLIGAVAATIAWIALAGNPLSDANEVIYETITVADVTAEGDQICWSRNPERRDAERLCAILALDPAVEPPIVGDVVTIGRIDLRPPQGEESRHVVYTGVSVEPAQDVTEPSTEPAG